MKGLDTNVLVRYLTQDHQKQARLAAKEIEGAAAKGEKLVIQPIVLCELVWVLESAYDFGKPQITAQFEIADKDTVWQALNDYHKEKGDFSDYYIGRSNEKAGANVTLTFDKSLKDDKRFSLIGS
jgi:predicted nucleic-acid-binding protein